MLTPSLSLIFFSSQKAIKQMVPLLPRPRSLARKMVGKNSTDQQKKKKEEDDGDDKTRKLTRLLITVSVAGSAGTLRFVVNENDLVSDIIHTTLKSYALLGRLPLLPSDPNNFLLYSPHKIHGIYGLDGKNGVTALSPKEAIGCCGARNFILGKKEANEEIKETIIIIKQDAQKQNRGWNLKWRSCFTLMAL